MTILVPHDGSDLSARALSSARILAGRLGESVHLLAVVDEPADADTTRDMLNDFAAPLVSEGIPYEVEVRAGAAADEIVNAAEAVGASMIVMSTHGRSGLSRLVHGSTAAAVIHRATVPVLAVPPIEKPATFAPGRIVVPVEQPELPAGLAELTVRLATLFDAAIDVVKVVPWTSTVAVAAEAGLVAAQIEQELEAEALQTVEQVRGSLGYAKSHGAVLRGSPGAELATYGRSFGAGLFAMGTRARAGLARMVLGSTAEHVISEAVAPVLLFRFGAEAEETEAD